MKNNPIYQVLVVSSNSVISAGVELDTLTNGQIAAFNADTNLSFDLAGAIPDKFYFAVGDTTDGVRRSAGQYMSRKLINTIYSKHPEAGVNQVVTLDLTSFTPVKETDYTIRMEFMSGQTAQMHGFDNPIKSFTYTTGSTAPSLQEFVEAFAAVINADDEALCTATEDDAKIIMTFGAEDKSDTVGGINPRYNFLRQFKVKVAATNGFDTVPSSWHFDSETDPVYEEGSGYDIQQLEYIAGGWNGKPGIYRDSTLNGLFASGNFVPKAVVTNMYYQLCINHEQKSNSGGMLNYSNQMETIIAIPNNTDDNVDFTALLDKFNSFMNTLLGTTDTGGTNEAYSTDE